MVNDQNTQSAGEDAHPSGFLYILSCEAMPGLYKIGMTSRSPYARAQELAQATAIPSPFEVLFAVFVRDRFAAEAVMHDALGRFRAASNREFFRFLSDEDALDNFFAVAFGVGGRILVGPTGEATTEANIIGLVDCFGLERRPAFSPLQVPLLLSQIADLQDQLETARQREAEQRKALADAERTIAVREDELRAHRVSGDYQRHQDNMERKVKLILEWCDANPKQTAWKLADEYRRGNI